MRVRVQNVSIRGKSFALIEDTQNGEHFFGTVPYSELDENGILKRPLNGIQMCAADTVAQAIRTRRYSVALSDWIERHPTATEAERVQFLIMCHESEAIADRSIT